MTDIPFVKSETVHFNDILTDCLIFVKDININLSADKKSILVKPINTESGNVIAIALYNGEKIIEMQTGVYTGNELTFTAANGYTTGKAMVWESITSLKPLCNVEDIK